MLACGLGKTEHAAQLYRTLTSCLSMMLMLKVMIMTFSRFLNRPDSLWLQRGKSGTIRFLFLQFDEYHNHCFRCDKKFPVPQEYVLL